MSQSKQHADSPAEKTKLALEETELSESDLESVNGGVMVTRGSDTCAAVNDYSVKVTVGGNIKQHG